MKRRKKDLIIVESPSKAKTISHYLGDSYEVKASMGHVKDLPANKMGVNIERDFEPEYVIIKGKEKVLKELKKAAKSANKVYLASDPDREGEAIAWHIANEIGVPDKTFRIVFHEITKRAIEEALKNPEGIDIRKVDSQQARRVLDRLVGYSLSPLLWRRIDKGLSAGRVQSVALKLICDREKEIEEFVPEEYWKIEALLGYENTNFVAELFKVKGEKIQRLSKDEAEDIFKRLNGQSFFLDKVEKKQKKVKPKPPFITSTLQQEAFKFFGFTSKKTMMIAQQLYEGIDIPGKGYTALITYMRTDSVRVADHALKSVRSFIKKRFGTSYLPSKPNEYKTSSSSQDAHEAIRPVNVDLTPDDLRGKIPSDHLKLYELIWRRFVASQMKPAVIDSTIFEIKSGDYTFKATGSVLKFEGYRKVYEDTKDKDVVLPEASEGTEFTVLEIKKTQHFTKPPPRYTEASLIKTLEEKGIGRPSTYATIVSTIIDRGYVVRDKKALIPTPLGRIVSEVLVRNFPKIMDVSFTASMEEDLDRIAKGEIQWRESIKNFYMSFSKELEKASENLMKLDNYSPLKCEKCGSPMVLRKSKYGKFLACSAYPKCRNVKSLNQVEGVKNGRKGKNKGYKKRA